MKRLSLPAVAAIAAFGLLGCADENPVAPESAPSFVPQASVSVDAASLDRHLVLFNGRGVPESFAADVAGLGGSVVYSHASGIAFVSGLSEPAAADLAKRSGVAEVMADEAVELLPVNGVQVEAADATPASPATPSLAFFYPRQWHLRAVGANQAWAAGRRGSSAVTVAILDTGIDYLLPDLVGRVDLSRSASFVPNDDLLVQANFPGRHPVTDLHYHGTHVAATVTSNALVAAGVTSGVTLIGVKVLGANGSSFAGSVIAGVLFAVDNGADVINMSLGGGFSKAGNGRSVGFINRVFNEANREEVTVVVAAGNESADLNRNGNTFKSYCDAPNVICVSATGPTSRASLIGPWANIDAFAAYSNFGSAIGVAAPGGNTGGSVIAGCAKTSLTFRICATGNFVLNSNGTSMASPHVAALAALLVEDGLKPSQIRARIRQSADDLGAPGTDPYYGSGRINIPQALGL
ncbi:MAG: S8 family serine peptidase [Gemmatimonadales bacterium]|nr:S8 family serine peptidase [Gemmatimonadales bacterium]